MDLGQIAMLRKGDFPLGHAHFMATADTGSAPAIWSRLGVLALGLAVLGLPVNDFAGYMLLLVVAVVAFCGTVTTRLQPWAAAAIIAAIAIFARMILSPPPIEEGHNVFLPSPALEQALPADVYRELESVFDAQYPPSQRCDRKTAGCWLNAGAPDTAFAFSADSVWDHADYSRQVSTLDFSDPVWLRLGFVNDKRYNWTGGSDIKRSTRDRRFFMGWHRWHLAMPWFEMIRVPAGFAGGQLCWRGTVLWESQDDHFTRWPGEGCRDFEPRDIGRRIFGVAVAPDSLSMRITPPWNLWLRQVLADGLVLAAIVGLLAILVELKLRRAIVPALFIGLAMVVIVIGDASFLGGVRPFDGGDDGLFYDGTARVMLQKLLQGDIRGFLEGGESVFYYGGPGLRYFRAIEHVLFGESYLGYLSLVLVFPFVVHRLFRRFLPQDWSLAAALVFVASPVGVLFGTSFVQYEELASRGFADPAAYILLIAGILPIVRDPEASRFAPALGGALLVALGVFMKPIVAPAALVLVGGAGLVAIYTRQWRRAAGLFIGFLPVLSMALHNWVFGHAFVLFSANADVAIVLTMPPSAYAGALHELLGLHFGGEHVLRFVRQIADWLGGPAESYATIPLSAAGVAILVYVVIHGRRFDPWLRLIGGAALAQHAVAFFYTAAFARYHFLSWFLTMLVVIVWFEQEGAGRLKKAYPALARGLTGHPLVRRLASGLDRLQRVSA